MKKKRLTTQLFQILVGIFLIAMLLTPDPGLSATFNSGSTGADGAFAPTANTVLNVLASGLGRVMDLLELPRETIIMVLPGYSIKLKELMRLNKHSKETKINQFNSHRCIFNTHPLDIMTQPPGGRWQGRGLFLGQKQETKIHCLLLAALVSC